MLGVASCDEDDLYAAMDWALQRKEAIENTLAAQHLSNGTWGSMTCPRRRLDLPQNRGGMDYKE